MLEELYRLVNPDEAQPEAAPANVTPIRHEDEVELEGMIGRPELKEVRGKTLFTAGLRVNQGEGEEWVSLAAWGPTAEAAATIRRGQVVRVVGKPKETSFVDSNGVMRSKRELTASLISPVVAAGSVENPSVAARA